MENRLELLREEVDKLIMNGDRDKICLLSSHIYGVSKFCALLAAKRNMNVELSAVCGMLHDIYYTTDSSGNNHALKGAEQAEKLLKRLNIYTDNEIEIIVNSVARHSDKRIIHEPYDELLKDADVMDHCFYNNDFPIAEWEIERYNKLRAELALPPAKQA